MIIKNFLKIDIKAGFAYIGELVERFVNKILYKMNNKNYHLFYLLFFITITTWILFFVGPEIIYQRLSSILPITHNQYTSDSIFQKERIVENAKITQNGQIGDSFGGTLGPIIAWIAAILTFAAFYVQYKSNEQQKIDLQIERFESKFYNMVEILRENVSEITIGKSLQSRKAFISMFNELKFLYLTTDKFFKSSSQKALIKTITGNETLSDEDTFNIAYLIFFFGIGQNSTKLILSLVNPSYQGLLLNLETFLQDQQINWSTNKKQLSTAEKTHEGDGVFTLKTSYKPFNGHMSRLSHYLRHLFQLIKFINDQKDHLINYDAKYNYAVTVRAQLSTHEQLLLYYNALSVLGKPWFDKDNDFLKKYCMIKNMPIPLADFYKKPFDVLPNNNDFGKTMFEWTEIYDRMNKSDGTPKE